MFTKSRTPRLAATVLALSLTLTASPGISAAATPSATPGVPAPAPAVVPYLLTLDEALTLAEQHYAGLSLALYQLMAVRSGADAVTADPAMAAAIAQAGFGITIPPGALTSQNTGAQAAHSIERAAAQYHDARQQVRVGTVQAYVEWQKATALVKAQEAALDQAITQEKNARTSFEVGLIPKLDLLQAEAAVAGQRAALAGARAAQAGARHGLDQLFGRPVADHVVPEELSLSAGEYDVPTDVAALAARAIAQRPDLRQTQLDVIARRSQAGLLGAGSLLQPQLVATQYHTQIAQATAEVQQALLQAQGARDELIAREAVIAPAKEALRLAELRYREGLATLADVQSASATLQAAEANRIQAAANLTLALAKLAQATGDL